MSMEVYKSHFLVTLATKNRISSIEWAYLLDIILQVYEKSGFKI